MSSINSMAMWLFPVVMHSDWDAWCLQGSHDDKSPNLGLLGGQEKHGLFDSGWDRHESQTHTTYTLRKFRWNTQKWRFASHFFCWNTSFLLDDFFGSILISRGYNPKFSAWIWNLIDFPRFSSRFFSLWEHRNGRFAWPFSEVAELPKIYVLPVVQIRQIDPEVPNFFGKWSIPKFLP